MKITFMKQNWFEKFWSNPKKKLLKIYKTAWETEDGMILITLYNTTPEEVDKKSTEIFNISGIAKVHWSLTE
jgi:hypothetical protein